MNKAFRDSQFRLRHIPATSVTYPTGTGAAEPMWHVIGISKVPRLVVIAIRPPVSA